MTELQCYDHYDAHSGHCWGHQMRYHCPGISAKTDATGDRGRAVSDQQERLVTIHFRIASRDFSARGPALEDCLFRAADNATTVFRVKGFVVGPYSANTVGMPDTKIKVPEAIYVVHEHEGHPLEGADHEHVHDGPHDHPNLGLGAIRTAMPGR